MSTDAGPSTRPDGKIQRNTVQLAVTKAQSSSPTYQLRIYRNGETIGDVSGRFAVFRDLYTLINADSSCDRLLKNKFPPTLAKSSIGVKMSPAEVEKRREMLDDWFRELFGCFNDFPPQSRAAVAQFVRLPEADVELVDPPQPEPEPPAGGDPPPQGASRGISMKGLVSAVKRMGSSKGGGDADSVTASQRSLGEKPPLPGEPFITVYVSRGSDHGGHQAYEVNIKYNPRERRLIVSKEFKHYRALMHALAAHGVRHRDYADGDNAPDADEEDIKEVKFEKVIPIAHAFPRTYKRSALGIALSEEALTERGQMLDRWMKDVLSLYHTFEPKAKVVVNKFLGYSDDYENEQVELAIEKMNIPFSVIGNPAGELPPLVQPQLEDRPDTVFVKAVRRDTLMQKNTVVISQQPENGHPMYTLQVLRSGVLLGETKGQFAKFRDLHMRLNKDNYINGMLTAPFPATKRRSSLGMKLTDDMVETRRQELNLWWIDLLDHFTDVHDDLKSLISEFLSIPREKLELVDGASPAAAPAAPAGGEPRAEPEPEPEAASDERDHEGPKLSDMVQRNTALITQAPDNGHPVYTLRIVRTVTVLAEVKGQFAVFRDLHAKLSEHAAFQGVLAAPFPVTKRRSSLGIKMNDDAVEERRQELNVWWTDVLNHFNDLKLELQVLVSDFLGIAISELELVAKAPPVPEGGKSSSLSLVFGAVGDGAGDASEDPIEVENVEAEWEEIPAAKKPQGCCVIS